MNKPIATLDETSEPAGVFRKILDFAGYCLYWAGYWTEHLLVLELEIARRVLRLADPRVHSEAKRIKSIEEGRLSKQTGKFFILVLFPGATLPGFTRSLIAALKASPFNLVVVLNASLPAATREELRDACCLMIERENVGSDFGGYKDAISVVSKRFGEPERLVIANDSVFYFRDGLDKLIADLDGPQDFIGVSEVFDHHYHVASFLISFGPSIVRSEAFRNFWAGFRPLGTRRWNIFRGEGALTENLVAAGFRPHILFRAEPLRPHVRARNRAELDAALAMLPTRHRDKVIKHMRREFAPDHLAAIRAGTTQFDAALSDRIADAIVDQIMQRNQMHAAGFLFRKNFNLPVIKRDIFYREIYPLDEIAAKFSDLDPVTKEEVMADLQRRGTAANLGFLRKFLYRHSAI